MNAVGFYLITEMIFKKIEIYLFCKSKFQDNPQSHISLSGRVSSCVVDDIFMELPNQPIIWTYGYTPKRQATA